MSSVLPPVPGVPVFNSDGYMDREWEVYFQELDDSLVSFEASLALKLSLATGLSPDNFIKSTDAGELEDALKAIPSGDVVGTTDVQTLTNKTLEDPTINDGTLNDSYLSNPYIVYGSATHTFTTHTEEWTPSANGSTDYRKFRLIGYAASRLNPPSGVGIAYMLLPVVEGSVYMIENQIVSPSDKVIAKAIGGTNEVTIAVNNRALVFCDGTDYWRLTDDQAIT